MGIMKDAEEMMVYLYQQYIKPDFFYIDIEKIKNETKWEKPRIRKAIAYLSQKGFINLNGDKEFFKGFLILGLSPEGIQTIEDEKRFKTHFSHTIDLKIYKFSWGATER